MIDYDRFAHYYDTEFGAFADDMPLLRYYAEHVDGPLLELGCGNGRVTVPLAQAGFRLTGVDTSANMLDIARKRLAAARLSDRVNLVQADMRTVNLEQRFGMGFIQVNSFMHLETQEDQRQALRCWHAFLRPGSPLILDLFNPDIVTLLEADGRLMVDNQWRDPQSGAVVIKQLVRKIDLANQIQETIFVYDEVFPDGQTRRLLVPFNLRFLWRSEAELLLELCGYELEMVYGSYDLETYTSDSPRMILVARRT